MQVMAGAPSSGEGNAAQIAYWSHAVGPAWVEQQERLDRQLEPLGRRAMEAAELEAGDHVLDVGAGCGATTLELARRVGERGRVVGLDVSRCMLERARARLAAARMTHAAVLRADAQQPPLREAAFDVLYSRFGVMFFASPELAFARLRRRLRPGGRLAFVCWQARERNPWVTLPLEAASRIVKPPPPAPPGAPGEFAFADPDRVRQVLLAAGFEAVEIEAHEEALAPAGGQLAEAVDFYLQVGPVAAALREAGADAATRERVGEALGRALEPFVGSAGLRLPSAAWVVRARNAASGS